MSEGGIHGIFFVRVPRETVVSSNRYLLTTAWVMLRMAFEILATRGTKITNSMDPEFHLFCALCGQFPIGFQEFPTSSTGKVGKSCSRLHRPRRAGVGILGEWRRSSVAVRVPWRRFATSWPKKSGMADAILRHGFIRRPNAFAATGDRRHFFRRSALASTSGDA